MPSLDNKAYLSVGGRAALVRPPDKGMSMGLKNWGSATQLINGSNSTVASAYSSRTFNMSWTAVRTSDSDLLTDMLAFAGTSEVKYLDRFVAGGNILSPLAGKPWVLAETLSPLSRDDKGVVLATSDGARLTFTASAATDDKTHEYTEKVHVPAGYRATVRAWGTATERVLSFNGVAVSATPTSVVATTTDMVVNLTFRAAGASAVVEKVTVVLTPAAAPMPTPEWTVPKGTTTLRVVPGSFGVTGINAVNGFVSLSCDLVEVWPWL